MNILSNLFRRMLRWILRFRNRCGYGIHSPFAFNLVTGVFYEKGEYYVYDELLKSGKDKFTNLRLKDNRLLFRLVNNHQPENGILIGENFNLTFEYITAGRKKCNWHVISPADYTSLSQLLLTIGKCDFVYIHSVKDLKSVLGLIEPYLYNRSVIVIHGLYEDKNDVSTWWNWIVNPKIRVTFDLYDFVLAYCEERLNKEDYVINYF